MIRSLNIKTISLGMMLTALSCGPVAKEDSKLNIVGGKLVGQYEHSALSTVALMTPEGQAFCTGSLVSPTIVLTAGHCVQGYNGKMLISFGVKAHRDTRMIGSTKRVVKRILAHPKYNEDAMSDPTQRTGMNDIAVLQLTTPAPKPFKHIGMLDHRFKVKRGERLVLAGFGITKHQGTNPGDRLRKVNTILEKVRLSAREFDFGPTMGKTACNGDSGGPAFVVRRNKKVKGQNSLRLIGVTSRGNFCQDRGTYTDIRYFVPWIKKVVSTWNAMDQRRR